MNELDNMNTWIDSKTYPRLEFNLGTYTFRYKDTKVELNYLNMNGKDKSHISHINKQGNTQSFHALREIIYSLYKIDTYPRFIRFNQEKEIEISIVLVEDTRTPNVYDYMTIKDAAYQMKIKEPRVKYAAKNGNLLLGRYKVYRKWIPIEYYAKRGLING